MKSEFNDVVTWMSQCEVADAEKAGRMSWSEHRVRAFLHTRGINPGDDPIGTLITAYESEVSGRYREQAQVNDAVESLKKITRDFVPF